MKKTMPADRQGFTLIELIVAVAIFSVIITVTFGSFSMAIRAQRRVILSQNIQENAQFILEFMAKELRMSIIDTSNSNGFSSSVNIRRNSEDNPIVVYSLDNGNLLRDNTPMNSDDIEITGNFYISGVGSDNFQPKLTVLLKLKGVDSQAGEMIINTQATLSQRLLDL